MKMPVRIGLMLAVLLLGLTQLASAVRAEAAPPDGTAPGSIPLYLNSREVGALTLPDDELVYRFTPAADGAYSFYSFAPRSGQAAQPRAALTRSDGGAAPEQQATVREGQFVLSAQLAGGTTYLLRVRGEQLGAFAVEVMRDSYGRTIERPIELPEGSTATTKSISKPRDTFWYTFTAREEGIYTIQTHTVGDEELDTQGYLLNSQGVEVSMNDDLDFPDNRNFCIRHTLKKGETYYVRVSAFSSSTGSYKLVLTAPSDNQVNPERITLDREALQLKVGGEHALIARLYPENAYHALLWSSSDPEVAQVSVAGVVVAHGVGQAQIRCEGQGGASASLTVTVEPVKLTGLKFEEQQLKLAAGESMALALRMTPDNATNQQVTYQVSNPEVAEVDWTGRVRGLSPGSCTVTATARDGGHQASLQLTVTPSKPVYRALVLGEARYLSRPVRTGAINTTQGIADMLQQLSFDGAKYQVTMQLDNTRATLLSGLNKVFARAKPTDVSLFYINCHGGYRNGQSYLMLHDGSTLTARQLEAQLRKIPGTVVVIIDCCQSGGFIGKSARADVFNTGVTQAFGAAEDARGTGSPFASGKYQVLTSSSFDQDSYRYGASQTEGEMATLFARSLCEGAGWDLVKDRAGSLKADYNRNRQLTLAEVYQYTFKRVKRYLKDSGSSFQQNVQVYPVGSPFVLFRR